MCGALIGHSVSESTREKLRKFREGKSYLELYGSLEKANEVKENVRKIRWKEKWNHSEETKQKISKILTGRKLSKQHRINIGLVQIGRKHKMSEETKKKIGLANKEKVTWIKGKHHSEETRNKISLANKGQIPWILGKHISEEHHRKLIESRLGTHHSEETKKNLSIKAKEHIRQFSIKFKGSFIGKYETHILDTIEEFFNYKIIRQKQVDTYFLDGYCPALNLAIEVDEKHHFKSDMLISDVERENRIKEILHCQFFRIKVV